MRPEVLHWMLIGLFVLAGLRALFRISGEGWTKAWVIGALGAGSFWVARHHPWGPWLALVVGLVALFVVARPSRRADLLARATSIVDRVAGGLDLDIHTGLIPLEDIRADLLESGLDPSRAGECINAYAARVHGEAVIFFTPGAASLAEDELAFIAAHEVGHHVLGHTEVSFLDRVGQVLDSTWGKLLAGGAVGLLWKHLVVPRRSQSHEFDADAWAIERLRRLGMSPSAGLTVMERFSRGEDASLLGSMFKRMFGTHPPAHLRMARIKGQLAR